MNHFFQRRCAAAIAMLIVLTGVSVLSADESRVDAPVDNTEPGRLRVPLSGTATVRRSDLLSVTPARIDTGLIEIGDSAPIAFTLTHTGVASAEPIVLGEARLIGGSAAEYSSGFSGFRTLSPGESVAVQVEFTPQSPGPKSAGMRIEIEGATSPHVVLFDGSSRYPLTSALGLSGGGTTDKVSFGQVQTGKSDTGSFTLVNLGAAEAPPINVSVITLGGDTPGDFTLDFTPSTIAPGETLTVGVTMGPGSAGNKKATLEVLHDGINPSVEIALEGEIVEPASVPVNFSASELKTATQVTRGTSIQFGPDGHLYVAEMDGPIHVFAVTRNGKDNYSANKLETIELIKNVTNHNDDGSANPYLGKRLLTGIHVTGSAAQPIIYAASSDPRQAAGPSGTDSNLDTNSGILHKLTKGGGGWSMQDLVRGLPRSEENHVPNGLLLRDNKILIMSGGHTNEGLPSNNFAQLPEYALSAALLEIDLGKINGTYDLPTLDDEDRPGTSDANDPFGGNNGKNQAKLVAGGPVQIFASGFRNAYDVVETESGRLYTFDNGPNTGWGGPPAADCLNKSDDSGAVKFDNLHLITKGSYAGHPNPTRGNKKNTFNASNPQSPVEIAANPIECQYQPSGQDSSLTTLGPSSNGLDEYTASNFAGAMKGDLVVASFNKTIYRIQLDGSGTKVTSKGPIATNLGQTPLDLTVQGDNDPFPGTVWVVDNLQKTIKILEPSDY